MRRAWTLDTAELVTIQRHTAFASEARLLTDPGLSTDTDVRGESVPSAAAIPTSEQCPMTLTLRDSPVGWLWGPHPRGRWSTLGVMTGAEMLLVEATRGAWSDTRDERRGAWEAMPCVRSLFEGNVSQRRPECFSCGCTRAVRRPGVGPKTQGTRYRHGR